MTSAKAGLVELDQELEPYDETLATMTKRERDLWGDRVVVELWKRMQGWRGEGEDAPGIRALDVVLLMGTKYASPIREAAPTGWTLWEPLTRLRMGERLGWLGRRRGRGRRGD